LIAALYVQRGGVYWDLEGVDPWDEARDARLYAGPWPVVAHPPCQRWSKLAYVAEARWGYKRGDDGGCFAAALASVRRWGGVLEHPAHSEAFAEHQLPKPRTRGAWQRGICGGWVCSVNQSDYGHRAEKETWLYAYGVELPDLKRGCVNDNACPVEWLPKKERAATPLPFRDLLISMARSAQSRRTAAIAMPKLTARQVHSTSVNESESTHSRSETGELPEDA
jgi:hypothetical protein